PPVRRTASEPCTVLSIVSDTSADRKTFNPHTGCISMIHEPIEAAQTILIVDDNPVNLGVVVEHLEAHGFQIAVSQGGEEARERAAFVQPDLILLDVMMPGIDGFETCRRLKTNVETRGIPVIFMTALADIHDKVSAFTAGGVDYVSKPF